MWDYFSSVFNWQWIVGNVTWMVLISAALRAWVWWSGKELSRKKEFAFWILGPLSVLVLLALIASPRVSSNRPRFVGHLAAANYGTLPDNRAYVLMAASIENTGAPSIAKVFGLKIQLSNGVEKEGELNTIPQQFTLVYANGTTDTVNYADQLHVRTVQPIPTGGEAVGRLMYVFPDLTEDTLKSQATGASLSFQDINGTVYTATDKFTGQLSEARVVIGLTPVLGQASPSPSPKKK